MRPARTVGGLRHLLPVMLCALAGHLALYRSFEPAGHAYFAWYEPLVAGLSVAAVAALVGLLLVAALGRDEQRQRVGSILLPATEVSVPVSFRAVRLALATIAFLGIQETIERTLGEGRLAPAAFGPAQIALVLVVVAAAASLVAVVEHSCSRLIALVVPRLLRLRPRPTAASFPSARPLLMRRRSPLAQFRGLRAPPLTV